MLKIFSKKIIFIGHDASRTGAPIFLLRLLGWLKKYTELNFIIVLKNGGELLEDFRKISDCYVWNDEREKEKLVRRMKFERFKLIYANTVASCEVIIELKQLLKNCKVICHVHELEISIRQFCGIETFNLAKNSIDYYVAASKAVKENLLSNHEISADKVKVIYELAPTAEAINDSNADKIRKELNLKNGDFLVIGSGTMDWRKGTDLFLQVASKVKELVKYPIFFCWVGGSNFGLDFEKLTYDVKKLQLGERLFFPGSKDNALDYFAACDLFCLTSREDPFPLVCLEAANLKKPVLCFDKSGGMPEFIDEECGFVVPYMNIVKMAERIIELYENPILKQSLGENAYRKVKNNHSVEIISKQISDLINNFE